MKDKSGRPSQKKHSRTLLILTSLYGILYLLFMITENYGTKGSEPIFVKFFFGLFLVGYLIVWKNEGLGGLIFVLWWIGMWCLGFFIAKYDRGVAVVMGFPLFVLAILFLISWYRRRTATLVAP